ncbi:MAG TPA: helix-turn-helix domain-containing protein [Candidatus Limnocylindrales bacterium]
MSPRQADTRQRALDVALELFADQGYEKTSLREIAERLDVTKAALYYHFASKEALLAGIIDSLVEPADELVAWSGTQPRTAEFRQEYLRRLAQLLQGPWSSWISFVQQNQPALRDHTDAAQKMRSRLLMLCAPILEPEAPLQDQVRSFLGLLAVYLGNLAPASAMLQSMGLEATPEELAVAAMDVAFELVGERTSRRP